MKKKIMLVFITVMLPFLVSGGTIVRDGVTINVNRTDEYQESVAKGIVKAPPDIVWNVITDFENHNKFMPNVTKSRIVSVDGKTWTVEKEISIVFKRIQIVLLSTEASPRRMLKWVQKKGPFSMNQGHWKIEPKTDGTSLVIYKARVRPSFYIPGWIQRSLTERSIPKLFKAIEKEAKSRM